MPASNIVYYTYTKSSEMVLIKVSHEDQYVYMYGITLCNMSNSHILGISVHILAISVHTLAISVTKPYGLLRYLEQRQGAIQSVHHTCS